MLSLAIISRKEDEQDLITAILSCIDHVDEIIVVDTSKDGSLRLPDYQDKLKLYPFTWTGDFSAARNFSFEQCTGDVIFWIDSDDVVRNPEVLPELAKKIEDGEADWIFSLYNYSRDEWGNVDAKHWRPRLIKKGTSKWQMAIHEDLTPLEAVTQVKDTDLGIPLVIDHMGQHFQESGERNLELLLAEWAEKQDMRTAQQIGIGLVGLEQYGESLLWFKRHLEGSGSKEDKYWSYLWLSYALKHLKRYQEAANMALTAIGEFPQWNIGYFRIADVYATQEDYKKVIEWTLTGLSKSDPDTLNVINELDLTVYPLGRLAEAYLYTMEFEKAFSVASKLMRINSTMPIVTELFETCREAVESEEYVAAVQTIVGRLRKHDRVKAAQFFDLLPRELDEDIRIQSLRHQTVPPKVWDKDSIVIFCGESLEDWAYPSIFTGIGGSEKAVINMSTELAKLGKKVTVYNQCGDLKGEYLGVTYEPYYRFNAKDKFATLISWRNPSLFLVANQADRKYLWLHDIAYPEQFNQEIIDSVDKILVLSKWHRHNLPDIPDDKFYITNNGIDPLHFQNLPEKEPNTLLWSSSYDRGLLPFIKNILPLIKKEIPEVTLHVAYGWQNIEKEMENVPSLKSLYHELQPILDGTEGIVHHGRISHLELAQLMGKCMVYPYASEFGETCNMTSMECQAAGCYVITTKQAGGTPERVLNGDILDCPKGIYTDKGHQHGFAKAVVNYLKHPKKLDGSVTDVFSWETTAKSWNKDLLTN